MCLPTTSCPWVSPAGKGPLLGLSSPPRSSLPAKSAFTTTVAVAEVASWWGGAMHREEARSSGPQGMPAWVYSSMSAPPAACGP